VKIRHCRPLEFASSLNLPLKVSRFRDPIAEFGGTDQILVNVAEFSTVVESQ